MRRILILLVLIGCLVGLVSAVDSNEGITSSQGSEVNLTKGTVGFTDVLSGISISTETIIDGEKFVPIKTKTDGESLTWSTGETNWFIFDDPNVALTYDYNGTFLKETIVLKEDKELSFPLKIDSNSRMVPYNGGFRIVPNEPLSTDKNGGYPPGIVIAAPFGYDSVGHYVPMSYGYDGEILTLEYDRTVSVLNKTLTDSMSNYESDFGDIVPQYYDEIPISYPLTIDPTYYLSGYSSYNVLLLHMNQTAGFPTYFYDSSVYNSTITPIGSVVTNTALKLYGNASMYSHGGTGDYLNVTTTSALNLGTGNATVSFWIYPRDYGSISDFAVDTQYSGAQRWYVLYGTTSTTAEFGGVAITGPKLSLYNWSHVYITRNASISYMYINGVAAGTPTSSTSSFNTPSSFKIGARYSPSGDYYANASIDEFALWTTYIPISDLYPQTTEIETAIAPVATFTANVTSGYQPLAAQFNETSASTGTSWQWNATALSNSTTFTFSTVQNATQIFDTGNFSIALKSTNGGGSNISTQLTWINVSSSATTLPTASFTTNTTSGAIPLSVLFTDTSTGPEPFTYAWDFGDITNTTTRNATHTYSSAGVYTVNLSVSNLNGTAYATPVNITATTVASGFNRVDLVMDAAYTLTVTFVDSVTVSIPVVTVIDNLGNTETTSTGVFTHSYSYGAVVLYVSSSGYTGKSVSYYMDGDKDEVVQLVQSAAVSQTATTWYVPKTIEFQVIDHVGNQIAGANVSAIFNSSSTLAGGDGSLVTWYGMNPTAANDAANGTLMMYGYSDNVGSVVFTMLSTLNYDVFVTYQNTTNYFNIHPQSSNYQLRFIVADGAVDTSLYTCVLANGNTHTGIAAPDANNITLMWSYQDTCGLTTALDYYVIDPKNSSFIVYHYTLSPVTSGIYVNNYTVTNERGRDYNWYENSTRSV